MSLSDYYHRQAQEMSGANDVARDHIAFCQKIQDHLEHSPSDVKVNPDIKGWKVEGEFICGYCAARLMGRGCFHYKASPLWNEDNHPKMFCIGCEEAK